MNRRSQITQSLLDRTEQYLANHGISLDKDGYLPGRKLLVDPMFETPGDDPRQGPMREF